MLTNNLFLIKQGTFLRTQKASMFLQIQWAIIFPSGNIKQLSFSVCCMTPTLTASLRIFPNRYDPLGCHFLDKIIIHLSLIIMPNSRQRKANASHYGVILWPSDWLPYGQFPARSESASSARSHCVTSQHEKKPRYQQTESSLDGGKFAKRLVGLASRWGQWGQVKLLDGLPAATLRVVSVVNGKNFTTVQCWWRCRETRKWCAARQEGRQAG